MPRLPLLLGFLLLGGTTFLSSAQWLEWDIQTDERLVLSSVANADDEEKDIWPAVPNALLSRLPAREAPSSVKWPVPSLMSRKSFAVPPPLLTR